MHAALGWLVLEVSGLPASPSPTPSLTELTDPVSGRASTRLTSAMSSVRVACLTLWSRGRSPGLEHRPSFYGGSARRWRRPLGASVLVFSRDVWTDASRFPASQPDSSPRFPFSGHSAIAAGFPLGGSFSGGLGCRYDLLHVCSPASWPWRLIRV